MTRIWLVTAAIIGGVLGGFLVGVSVAKRVPLGAEASVEWHWKRVNDYRAFMNDSKNYSAVPGTGLNASTPPYDPVPSLIALDRAGEIDHIDVVLPNVPYYNAETTHHCLDFYDAHKEDILWATGNPSYTGITISGTPPIRLNLWFRKLPRTDIQKLIEELEALACDQRVDDLQSPLDP